MYTCHVRMDRFALVSSVSSRLFLLDKDESSGTAALALMTVVTQLLLWAKLLSSLLYLGQI